MKTLLRVLIVSALAACWSTGKAATDSVSYVANVDCTPHGCTVYRKHVPVDTTVQERVAGDVCLQYRQRLAGFLNVPSADPRTSLQVPRFERSGIEHVRCGWSRSGAARLDIM